MSEIDNQLVTARAALESAQARMRASNGAVEMMRTGGLTPAEADRLRLREALRATLLDFWEQRSRDAIEDTPAGHVDEMLRRAIMPVLDEFALPAS